MASTEKRDVIIKVTDKGLKEVTSGLNKLHNLITQIEAKPLTVGAKVNTAGVKKATKSTKEYSTSISAADRAAKSAGNSSLAAAKGFSKQAQGLGGLVHIYATVAANIWAMGAAFDQLRQAADLRAVIQAQDELAASSGRSLKAVTKALHEGSQGALSLANSMKLANTVASAGFGAKFAKDISNIAGGASKALGRDLTDSIERLTKGIAKMEPEILDELGIFVKLETATRKYADANNLVVKDLTEFERRQAFANEALKQGNDAWGSLNKEIGANQYAVLSAALSNVKDTMVGVASQSIEATGILESFAGSTQASAAGIFLLAQRLTKMAIPELKNFGNAFKLKAIDSATEAFNRFDVAAEKSVTKSGTIKGFAVMKEGAKRAGAAMHSAFLLGASGASKAETNLDLLNLQLFSTGRLATKAAGAMLFLGKAVNRVAGWASKLGKALGWVAIAQVAFTLLEGAVKKVLGHFELLDGLAETFDKIGAATGLWDPSGINAVDDALVDLDKNLEDPIKGFQALEEASKNQFISPVKRAKQLSNVLKSLQDEVLNLNTELAKVPVESIAYQEIGNRAEKGINSFIKTAKKLKQAKLAKELEAIKKAATPGNMLASLKAATHAVNKATDSVGRYSAALETQQKGVEDLNSATKRYYDSIKVSTKLDDILGFYDTTGIDDFITRLDTVSSISIHPETQDASDKFRTLSADVAKYQSEFDAFEKSTGVHLEIGTSLDTGGFIGGLNKSKKALADHLDYVKGAGIELTDADVIPELSQKEVDVFVNKMNEVKDSFLGLVGLSDTKITGLRSILKGIEAGDAADPVLLSGYMTEIRTGVNAVVKSQQKLRASALEVNRIAAEGATARVKNAVKLNDLTNAQTLGKISKEQLAVEKLKLNLSGQQADRLTKVSTLSQKILQLETDASRATDTKTEEGIATKDAIIGQVNALKAEKAILVGASGIHDDISSKLVERLEYQQALNASVKENIMMIRSQAGLEEAQADSEFGSQEQGLSMDQTIDPEGNFTVQQAQLEVERELLAIGNIKAEQLANEKVLREELLLIEDQYLNGAVLQAGSADSLAITRLTTKISESQKLLAISKQLSVEKQKELKLNVQMAKIVSPFDKIAKALDRMDTNAFTKLAKGANKFAKVSKVSAKLVQEQKDAGKDHTEAQLKGYADQSSAMGSMFDEGSAAAKFMYNLENAIHLARMAFMASEMIMSDVKMQNELKNETASLGAKVAGGFASMVSSAGPYGLALGAAFLAIMASLTGGSSGGGGGATTAGVDAQLKKHNDSLGANGVSSAREMETNALTGAITDLTDIDTRLYSSMDNLQGSIVELGKTFKSVGGSTARAFGGFSERGLQEQFEDIPEFGKGLVEGGAYKRPIERTLEDVLLQIAPELSTIDVDPASVKKATDFLAVSFDDITALIITKALQTKASDGSLKKAWVEELEREFGNEYAAELSDDLNDAFNSTIDTTFGLLQALDPGAHIGTASNEFTTSVSNALIDSVNSGSFAEDLSSLISVKDLSSSEAADRISVYFNDLSDEMIRSIFPVLDSFRLAGEELGDTLSRMVGETAAAVGAFSLLGFTGSIFSPTNMDEAGVLANTHFQAGLFKGFSDTSAWADLTNSFTEAILTETELIDNKISLIEQDIAAGFSRSVSDILNLPGISGLSNLGTEITFLAAELSKGAITAKQAMQGLRTVWEDASEVVSNASSGFTSEGIIGAEDFSALGTMISGIISTGDALGSLIELQEDRTIARAAEETGKTLQDYLALISNLRDTINSMLLGDLSPLSKGAKLDLAKSSLDELVTAISSETDESKRFTLIEDLESHALDYLNLSKEYYGGVGNYVSEFDRVKSILEGIEGELSVTAQQLTVADQTLSVLNSTYDLQAEMAANLRTGLAELIAAINSGDNPNSGGGTSGTLESAPTGLSGRASQINDIYRNQLGRNASESEIGKYSTGTLANASTTRIRHEVANSGEAVSLALTGHNVPGFQENTGLINIYKEVLGRLPDVSGYLYWDQRLKSGETLQSVRDLIAHVAYVEGNSGESNLPAFAEGGITSGTSVVGEAGPEAVVPLPNGRSIPVDLGTGMDFSEIVTELRNLREAIDNQSNSSEDLNNQVIDLLTDNNSFSSTIARNINKTRGPQTL